MSEILLLTTALGMGDYRGTKGHIQSHEKTNEDRSPRRDGLPEVGLHPYVSGERKPAGRL